MNPNLLSRSWRWGLLALVLGAVIWLLAPVLAPFVVAAVLAYILHAPVSALQARGVPRLLAVLAVEALALLALSGLLLLLVPVLLHELPLLREQVPRLAVRFNETLVPLLARLGVEFSLDVAAIKAMMLKVFGGNADELILAALSSLRIGGSVALAVVGYLVLVPVALYYLLVDAHRLSAWAASLVPPRLGPSVFGFARECDDLLSHYLRGQVLVMLALAAYYTLALMVLGFDLAVPVGLFTGLAIFVPYLGFGVGLAMALLAGVLQFGPVSGAAMVAAVYGAGQLLESFVLTPRWVGERIGLSPLAVIFALLAFGQLLGFVGVLIALPASAVLLVLLRRAQSLYFDSKLYRG
ncbi:MAG: AI-2E family transporter [Betaproteobacteria bacterium]|nr:AI-2E family transporter [Betaproteobacteria bacterium]NBT10118.1 AI-2E family transporter [Betaproteobacteria bacterium]NBU48962.1 AI-2E family transporter [Betaproteobacteria bacterium]